ncbi:DUF2877 domain-containing protein [Neobacillus vireti]|uniref:DUF2877 domain-containing protein n=1 Tax=Neobacillus vireti LMG 21834 TaxID=1131730 RepID=A0AB94ILD8_9BACI|nr:DUF2877 domain-containing protein [Neobacillus vireti]ETI67818.1 hypothetical protein BAVI_15827 [Neobacillus vireti LMG 21834]
MIKSTLFGEGYSDLIPLLLSKKGNGHVHSIFKNGFNIKMDDSLVFIGNKKNGLLPFGIHLLEVDTLRAVSVVNNGEAVFWNTRTNSLEFSSLSISLEKGHRFKNELTSLKSNQVFEIGFENLCAQLSTMEELTGLDIDINQFLKRFNGIGEKKWFGPESYLVMLIEVVMSSDRYLIEKTLRYFLGRGKGLTPSGDDMIVGLLAFDATSNFISALFYQQLSELLESEPITTDVSREYLRYAIRHEFGSTVTELVNSLASGDDSTFNKAFQNLLEVGHSSGLDTLFGILIGMLAFKNPNEQ